MTGKDESGSIDPMDPLSQVPGWRLMSSWRRSTTSTFSWRSPPCWTTQKGRTRRTRCSSRNRWRPIATRGLGQKGESGYISEPLSPYHDCFDVIGEGDAEYLVIADALRQFVPSDTPDFNIRAAAARIQRHLHTFHASSNARQSKGSHRKRSSTRRCGRSTVTDVSPGSVESGVVEHLLLEIEVEIVVFGLKSVAAGGLIGCGKS
jgi:hypothetical protein